MKTEELFDLTIIGGGPAGLYSAFYGGLRGMKTKIIEFQPQLGGKLHVYPEKMIWDVGGQPPIQCARLIEQLTEQAMTFNPDVVLGEKVESLAKDAAGNFRIETSSGKIHFSKTVIVAVGGGILNPQKLNIQGAERFEVSNLNYTVKSLERFKGKTVLISGGGNSAIDWANELSPIAEKIYVTYRKAEFTGHEAQVEQLMGSGAVCLLNTSISRLIASDNRDAVELVELTDGLTGDKMLLPVDEVIINHGYEQDASLIENSPLPIKQVDDFYISGTPKSESSVTGLYAAGDILKHEGKLNLIAGTFVDAANAVNQAKLHIQPEATEIAMVSSHNDVFKKRNKELVQQMLT